MKRAPQYTGMAILTARGSDRRRASLAATAGEPAHAMLNIALWRGDAAPPFEPPWPVLRRSSRAGRSLPVRLVGASLWRSAARSPPACRRCYGRPWHARGRGTAPAAAVVRERTCQVARIAGQPQPDRPLVHSIVRTAFDVPSRTWWRGLSHCHRASAYSAMPDSAIGGGSVN